MNELAKELIKELVTEELISSVVSEVVTERVDYLFDYKVEKAIDIRIAEIIRDKADTYIKQAIEKVISNKLRTDDGWGNTATYGSFEDLVHERIGAQLRDGWNVERQVRNAVDDKIKKLCESVRKEHVDNMADQVMERLAAQYKKEDNLP